MWANEFVREKLWDHGLWVASALQDASLDAFMADRMQATGPVRVKCRNNYRHLFELCDYWPSELAEINAGADEWIASALYLAWDRHVLDGGALERKALLNVVSQDELHKLMGMPEPYVASQSAASVDTYLSVSGPARFSAPPVPEVPLVTTKKGASKEPPTDLSWLDQEESDEVVERHTVQVQQQKRDRKTAARLKRLYRNECMICGVRLQVAEEQYYSEAAHIRPLGKPHDGPDKPSNMLVLCPNHHLQFDRGVLRLRLTDGTYSVTSRVKNDPNHKKAISLKHDLDADCVGWHRKWFRLKRA